MRQTSLLIAAFLFLISFSGPVANAQRSNEPAKVELGGHVTSITGPEFQPFFAVDRPGSQAGFGGRFTYNLNKHVALEAEGNFFARPEFDGFDSDNHIVQGQFGLKTGNRFDKFGIFAKVRPGFMSLGDVLTQTGTETIDINGQPVVVPVFDFRRRSFFSIDLGGVLEFYPSRRFVVRFDAGDTMIR